MISLKIRLIEKKDRNGDDYYFTTTHVPCSIDLSNAVIHFYPDEESEDKFGGEMVIRHYDPRTSVNKQDSGKQLRRRRVRRNTSNEGDHYSDVGESEEVVVESETE